MTNGKLSAPFPKPDALTPAEIEAKAEDLGVSKTSMSIKQSFILSLMAGAFISMGAMFFTLVVGYPIHHTHKQCSTNNVTWHCCTPVP